MFSSIVPLVLVMLLLKALNTLKTVGFPGSMPVGYRLLMYLSIIVLKLAPFRHKKMVRAGYP